MIPQSNTIAQDSMGFCAVLSLNHVSRKNMTTLNPFLISDPQFLFSSSSQFNFNLTQMTYIKFQCSYKPNKKYVTFFSFSLIINEKLSFSKELVTVPWKCPLQRLDNVILPNCGNHLQWGIFNGVSSGMILFSSALITFLKCKVSFFGLHSLSFLDHDGLKPSN